MARERHGEVELSDPRLREVYAALMRWEYEHPEDSPGGESWSAVLGELAAALEERPGLEDHAVLAAQLHAARLARDGRRGDALAVLEGALERHPSSAYALSLRLDLGTLLRDEHDFGRALLELRAAQELVKEARGQNLGLQFAANLRIFEALVQNELGAAADALGMTDYAVERLAEGEQLALALDAQSGPAVWGANLVYALNFAIDRERGDLVEGLRTRYQSHAWRARLPEETDEQIRVRLAIALANAAFRGEAPPGAGEAELRELVAAGLKLEEDLRARLFLARSLLDRGELADAERLLEEAARSLGAADEMEPLRLHLVGLRSRGLRAAQASPEELRRFLEGELRPAFEAFLARAARGPIEEAGVSPLLYDWVRESLSELFELELAAFELGDAGAGAERAFEWLARLHAVGTFAREQGLAVPALSEIRAELIEPEGGLLAFVPGRVTSHAFAVDGEGLAIVPLGKGIELDRRARALEEALQAAIEAPSARADARLAAALDAASQAFLPAELTAVLARWSSLVVVGLDDFGYLPLEALHGVGGRPVGHTHAVTYVPSLPVALWLARRARALPPAGGPVVLYVGNGDPALGGRPGLAAFELDPARLGSKAFADAGVPCEIVLPAQASSLSERLARARMATFFVHGLYDATLVRPAGLLVVPEDPVGGWFAPAIEALPPFPLAVVAACGSDRAPLRRGDDGRGHLRASFFRGGTVSFATATLALELEATADFCALVSARLAAGDSVAEAFRSARVDARPQERGVHPIHAHLLHVFGEGRLRPVARENDAAAEEPRERASLPWLLGGLALIVLVSLVVRGIRSPSRGRSSAGA